MLDGAVWKLSWIETKIFTARADGIRRHAVHAARLLPHHGALPRAAVPHPRRRRWGDSRSTPTILAPLLIVLSAVQSLVAIMAIYREGGILKRLRATPLSPVTILSAHVLVKLVLDADELPPPRARRPPRDAGRDAGRHARASPPPSSSARSASSASASSSRAWSRPRASPSRSAPPSSTRCSRSRDCSSPWRACRLVACHRRDPADDARRDADARYVRGHTVERTAGSVAALLAIFAVCLFLATKWFRWE